MIRALLLCVAMLAAAPQAAQASISSLYVFGDSLSDNGNAFALSGGTWPPSPPYAQQFSNGPVAAEQLADRLGVTLTRSTAGGTNFAIGGATTGFQNFNFEVSSPFPLPSTIDNTGMFAQVSGFMSSGPSFSPSSSLFMLWAAPNDFFLALAQGTNPLAAATAAVTNIATAIGGLVSIGATQFLVPNMPNLAETPFGLSLTDADRIALDALSLGFNNGLAQAMAQLRAAIQPGVPEFNLMEFDTAAFLHDVIGSPTDFGFTNVTEPCFNPADPGNLTNVLAGCQGFLFFDTVHPTAAAHLLLGDRFFATVPEPATWALLLVAVVAISMTRRHTTP
jgi:phospholipase/lecithinase/hemolysin